MLSWLARRRARMVRTDAEAEALIRDLGDRAYSEARRREREASSDEIAEDWGRVALAVARKSGKRVGLDTTTRMARDADFSLEPHRAEPPHQPPEETDPLDELTRIVSEAPSAPYRLQFLGAGTDRGPSILNEVELRVSEPSEAVREAARLRWPPRAIGFRLIDGDGREVFGRDRR
jgi:hypothetical protein